MTRTAPYLTLGAVAVLGGGLFLANGLAAPAPAAPGGATPVVAAAPAAPAPAPAAVPEVAPPAVGATVPDPAGRDAAEDLAGDAGGGGGDGGGDGDERVGGDLDYAGETDDGDMTVAISVRGGEATAYVCGAGLEVWLQGNVSADGELDLASASGRSTLTGTGAAGDFASDGVERGYTAGAVDVAEAVAAGRDDVGEVAERVEAPEPVRAPEPETSGTDAYGSY